ncbi:uncharacterized protein [Maniola hyperantus]|uniref:uncharacterized protein isoform X2 n=1 Tax=Aphantopus hyperantus TaxID=2795564 RepID=UPI003748C586
MMSEHQFRKTTVSRDHIQRPTNNLVKAGDMAAEKTPARLKSKNTLPKNLRYDLENALVGLCDVWFEDIKPYLERNNIKVHVHEPVEGNGQGDSARGTGAPNCAHLHPGRSYRRQRRGASCVASCSTPLTASRAPCRRPPASPPVARHPTRPATQSKLHQSNEETNLKAVIRRTRKKKPKAFHSRRVVPRLCQTYSKLIMELNKEALTGKPKSSHRNNTKDLIDIIAEKHDKMLSRVLHRSPDRLDTSRRPSSLNLFSPYKPGKKSTSRKKTRPWR